MSRSPAMTLLLNGQAVKVWLASTSVTVRRGSSALRARAQLAPAKPPPTTTTWPPVFWAIAGRGKSATEAPAAAVLMKSRRLVCCADMISILLCGVPGRNRLRFVVGESFGDAVHDGRGALAGLEVLHGGHELRGVASGEPRHRGVDRAPRRMAAGAGARAGRRVG